MIVGYKYTKAKMISIATSVFIGMMPGMIYKVSVDEGKNVNLL